MSASCRYDLLLSLFCLSWGLPLFGKSLILLVLIPFFLCYRKILSESEALKWPRMMFSDSLTKSILIVWVLYFLYTLIGTYVTNGSYTHNDGPIFILVAILLFYIGGMFAFICAKEGREHSAILVKGVIVTLILVSVNIFLQRNGLPFIDHGITGDINVEASISIMLTLSVLAGLFLNEGGHGVKILGICALIFSFYVLFFCETSDARVPVLFLGILIVCVAHYKDGAIIVPVVLFVALTLFLILNPETLKGMDLLTNAPFQQILSGRDRIWMAALHILGDNPVFGIGPGAFSNFYIEANRAIFGYFIGPAFKGAHSIPLRNFLAHGLIGGMFSLLLVILFAKLMWKMLMLERTRQLALLFMPVGFVICTYGLVDTGPVYDPIIPFIWLPLGFLCCIYLKKEQS